MGKRLNPVTKIVQSDLPTPDVMLTVGHKTCLKEVRYYYKILNRYVFADQLTMPSLKIKKLRDCWALCEGYVILDNDKDISGFSTQIILNSQQLCPQLCLVSLAHEMVHQYQWQVLGPQRLKQGLKPLMSHGPSFFRWRKKFHNFGIPLATGHRALKIAYHQDIWAN
jgi:hypothetical protein